MLHPLATMVIPTRKGVRNVTGGNRIHEGARPHRRGVPRGSPKGGEATRLGDGVLHPEGLWRSALTAKGSAHTSRPLFYCPNTDGHEEPRMGTRQPRGCSGSAGLSDSVARPSVRSVGSPTRRFLSADTCCLQLLASARLSTACGKNVDNFLRE